MGTNLSVEGLLAVGVMLVSRYLEGVHECGLLHVAQNDLRGGVHGVMPRILQCISCCGSAEKSGGKQNWESEDFVIRDLVSFFLLVEV